jgi:hypothetical protein
MAAGAESAAAHGRGANRFAATRRAAAVVATTTAAIAVGPPVVMRGGRTTGAPVIRGLAILRRVAPIRKAIFLAGINIAANIFLAAAAEGGCRRRSSHTDQHQLYVCAGSANFIGHRLSFKRITFRRTAIRKYYSISFLMYSGFACIARCTSPL